MKFIKLTENNDWEGETWHFFLQLDGNEEGLGWLSTLIHLKEDEPFHISMEPVSEEEVDILVKHSDSGYMNTYNKVTGTLDFKTLQDDINTSDVDEEWWYPIGKGDIKSYFK